MSQSVLRAKISDQLFNQFINSQIKFEKQITQNKRKQLGIFLTNDLSIIDNILDIINFDDSIFAKKILEPSCGYGIFLLRLLFRIYQINSNSDKITSFIENNLFFVDIDLKMLEKTKLNIKKLYFLLFNQEYLGKFHSLNLDFTKKGNYYEKLYGNIDYVIGNPPYITLYGRRDKKESELQRIYYLNHYKQFPKCVKNGKINYVMLFIEHSLDYLKYDGKLSFIIDMSFFESAYIYTRKYLLENTQINSVIYNINEFNVASGQVILKLTKSLPLNIKSIVEVIDAETKNIKFYDQTSWYNEDDEYKFRISNSEEAEIIINSILKLNQKSLKDLYPHKNLRTCTMLLDMEDKFVFNKPQNLKDNIKFYPYYQGSKSLPTKFTSLKQLGCFYYDKELQDQINDELKIELEEKGIKNKKRIGLGESIIYDYPKVYIRQSAKEIIATYDDKSSAANNSLYLFTLRSNSDESIKFLKFLCGYLNSDLITFFCQQKEIIRYRKGKQPQIKISDLYSIPIPTCEKFKNQLAELVDSFYQTKPQDKNINDLLFNINKLIYQFINITEEQINYINKSIKSF